MRAAFASAIKPDEPLAALTVGDLPDPAPPEGWVTVDVRASSLNRHDLWSLRGVGLPPDRLPMILGCDAAGVDADGNEVVVYPVVPNPTDPRGLSLLSERHPGTGQVPQVLCALLEALVVQAPSNRCDLLVHGLGLRGARQSPARAANAFRGNDRHECPAQDLS